MSCGIALAQQPSNGSSATLAYEDGRIENNVYTNECFGFSFAIPDGWEMNTHLVSADGRARFMLQWQLSLLQIDHREHEGGRTFPSGVTLRARSAIPDMTVEEFVSHMVHDLTDVVPREDTVGWRLIRDTYSVEYGGRHFARSDYKEIQKGDDRANVYLSFVYTKFRGYFIGAAVISGSLEALDHSANTLENISFQEDERNRMCVVAGGHGYPPGFNFADPVTPSSKSGLPQRVRVSLGVSTGLLVTKVQPQYPEDARQDRIQGEVVLQALIDKTGDVEKLTLVSGHPLLAPAAIAAVKQWKYKPYLLNGQPVKIETQIVVNFQLSGH